MGLEQLRGFNQPRLDVSGMEKKLEGDAKGVKESLVYYNKAGKEFVLYSTTTTKQNLLEAKQRVENNISVLEDPDKVKNSKDALVAQLADLDAKLTMAE